MLRAVIFDFDGVIADTEYLHFKAFNMVFDKLGVNITKDKYYSDYLGFSDIDCIRAVNKDYNLGLGIADYKAIIAKKSKVFDKLAVKEGDIIEGAAEMINMLRQNSVRIGICSGALLNEIKLMLSMSGFSEAFEVIVAADHVSKGKPDPEGYLLALERLNSNGDMKINPQECIVIEDSQWGLEAAGAANMRRIAVTNTYHEDILAPIAEMTVSNLADVSMEKIKSLCPD